MPKTPGKEALPAQLTPLMEQYYGFKDKHPGILLLFRVGDFYETFGEDAILSSRILDIVLTKRSNGKASETALAGFPHHALETYLPQLIQAGHRVAICDQTETPEEAKRRGSKLVRRKLTEIVTPALALSQNLLKDKENRYLAALFLGQKQDGLSLFDLSTGTFLLYEGTAAETWTQLEAHEPVEILFSKEHKKQIALRLTRQPSTFAQEPWVYSYETAKACLLEHFGTANLKGFGIDHMHEGLIAAGAILQYLQDTAHTSLSHVSTLRRLDEQPYLWMDTFTVRNLELFHPLQADGCSLVQVMDKNYTPMGGRLLRHWLRHPLRQLAPIEERQHGVAYFLSQPELRTSLQEPLAGLGDVERLVSKVALHRALPKDLLRLTQTLRALESVKSLLKGADSKLLSSLSERLSPCGALADELGRALCTNVALSAAHGRLFQKGYDEDLDKLLEDVENEDAFLQQMQAKESTNTGINSLKVGYTRVFGYYLEVRHTHKDKVPAHWIRKQTLTGAERYITEELKAYEERMLSIEAQRIAREEQLWDNLLKLVLAQLPSLQQNAAAVAQIDVLNGFAELASTQNYVAPVLDDSQEIEIRGGRHLVVESRLPPGSAYVPNDLLLDADQQLILITGPNMAGKSALLRQTALIVILAQIGAFVPADFARIGLRDKLFTRVGAGDSIAAGQSTFMMEMSETASILNNMSDCSLILMDEIGRGTSTYDGLSVAWAILEHIHAQSRAMLLFATHYHQLCDIEKHLERMKCFHVAVKEVDKQVVFLYKLRPGSTGHSFGIHVARMAGMPPSLLLRAEEVLTLLQQQQNKVRKLHAKAPGKNNPPPLF